MAGSSKMRLTMNQGEHVRRLIWVLAVSLLAFNTAEAQRGMGGMGGARGGMGGMGGRRGGGAGGGGARAAALKFPAAKTLEKYNPAALMLDKHKKLSLDDAQQENLKALQQQIFERNATIMARYDSLQRDFRPPRMDQRNGDASSPAADSTRRVAMMQMRQLRLLVDSLQDRRRTDVQEVLKALSDEAQRKKAAEFLDKQDEDFSKEFPQQLLQRGNRGEPGEPGEPGQGGMGRGGRRPPSSSLR
jgi:hypothetical protein